MLYNVINNIRRTYNVINNIQRILQLSNQQYTAYTAASGLVQGCYWFSTFNNMSWGFYGVPGCDGPENSVHTSACNLIRLVLAAFLRNLE